MGRTNFDRDVQVVNGRLSGILTLLRVGNKMGPNESAAPPGSN
ncbi:hypothetical protein [Serratia inhibens]|nr:hypothetical protein [Serratia inhibens]